MKTLKESVLADIDKQISVGQSTADHVLLLNKITSSKEAFYEFVTDYLKTNYKKYKCIIKRSRAGLGAYENTKVELKNFNTSKKYFLISVINLSPSQKGTTIRITKDNYIYPNVLTSLPVFTAKAPVELFKYNFKFGDDTIAERMNGVDIAYEVPKDLEWLYDYIKDGKL